MISTNNTPSLAHKNGQQKQTTTSTPVKKNGPENSLKIKKVIGTTASRHTSMCLVGNSLAYTAGAGAVVTSLNSQGRVDTRTTFFCTSTKAVQEIQMNNKLGWMTEYMKESLKINSTPVILGTEGGDSSPGKSAKDKMKTSSALAVSYDGRYLAVGETGHQPRVFIYNIKEKKHNLRAILNEHRYGIRAIAFSPNGQYLATLGTTNDGFLHIWNLQDMQLHSSNRCISEINDLKWIGNTEIITVGVRHVRMWRLDTSPRVDNNPQILNGRNVILREHSGSIFTTAVPLSDNMTLIASEKGDIATVQNFTDDKLPVYEPKLNVGFEIWAMDIDIKSSKLWVAGSDIKGFNLAEILSANISDVDTQPSMRTTMKRNSIIYGLEVYNDILLLLDSKKEILIANTSSVDNITCIVSAHPDILKGIRAVNDKKNRFLTWSSDGVVRLWNTMGNYEDEITIGRAESELTTALMVPTDSNIIVGDTSGFVEILNWKEKRSIFEIQAHGSSVVDIDYIELENGIQLFATCSRDRTIQILSTDKNTGEWRLHQTLAAHKGNIMSVRFSNDGKRIFSCSSDRTINIHTIAITEQKELVGFLPDRVISLKSTPSDMVFNPETNSIIISCDKQILIYDANTGELSGNYRTMDEKESINLNTISVGTLGGKQYLCGMSSDRAIKVFEHPSGNFIGSDWGHSEGISGLVWLNGATDSSILASSGNEGCIFLWEFVSDQEEEGSSPIHVPGTTTKSTSPERKILSKAELAKFMPSQTLSPIPQRQPSLSPFSSPKSIRTPTRMARSPSPKQSIKQPFTSTPSKTELQMRKSPVSRKDDNISGVIKDLTIDDLCRGLHNFRERYKKAVYGDQAKINKLKDELRQTVKLLSDENYYDRNEKELVEHFGVKLLALVNERLR